MNARANSPSSDHLAAPPETRRDRRARLIAELTDIGMDIAHRLNVRDAAQEAAPAPGADAPAAPGRAPDVTIQFERVALGIRRCMMLAERFEQPVVARAGDVERRRVVARRQIIRTVEDSIAREWFGEEADALEAELHERVETGEFDDEIDLRPLERIIADIRNDFGLGVPDGCRPPFKRREPAAVETLCERAARPPGKMAALVTPTGGPERFFRLVAQPDGA